MNVTRSMREADVRGKRVLVRVDFSVLLDAEGAILDDARIRATLPTIEYLLDHDAIILLASHLGRPKGSVAAKLSLRPVAVRLSEILGRPVLDDAFGAAHRAHASTAAVARLLPAYAGFLMERELETLGRLLTAPDHPFAVITGGAKISGKVAALQT